MPKSASKPSERRTSPTTQCTAALQDVEVGDALDDELFEDDQVIKAQLPASLHPVAGKVSACFTSGIVLLQAHMSAIGHHVESIGSNCDVIVYNFIVYAK